MEKALIAINDTRTSADLRSHTFSGYKRCRARSALRQAFAAGEVEPACYWGAELLCSFKPEDFWEEVIWYYTQTINIASINLAVYIKERILDFKRIANEEGESGLRNNYDVRRIFAEITAILILSRKRQPVHKGHKLKDTAFELVEITPLLRANNSELGRKHILPEDPPELYIAINELTYHVETRSGDLDLACYWVDWVLAYICAVRKAKRTVRCARRAWPPVQEKYTRDPVWMIWDCLRAAARTSSESQFKVVDSLSIIYCLKFTESSRQRRKQVIYTALACLIEPPRHAPPLCTNEKKLNQVKNKIDLVYGQIKNAEVKPRLGPHELEAAANGNTK